MKDSTTDAHDGPPNKMQRKHNDLDAGFQAFKDALAPQEGQFSRGATWILNDPKDREVLANKPHRADLGEKVARATLERNAKGHFIARDYSEVK